MDFTYICEIKDMCHPLDLQYSLSFVSESFHIYAASNKDAYRAYVLSTRNDVEYLGELDDKTSVASGSLHHIKKYVSASMYVRN